MKGVNGLKWIVNRLVDDFIKLDIIEEGKKDNYLYGAEFLIMKIAGIIILSVIGILSHKYIETVVFYATFNSLRKYTNGYHSINPRLCILESIITYSLISFVLSEILVDYIHVLHFITFISLFIIYVLSPVNSDSIMLDENEIEEHKEIIKYVLFLDLVILAMFVNFRIKPSFVVFFDLAILLDLLLVLIGKMAKSGKELSDEKY